MLRALLELFCDLLPLGVVLALLLSLRYARSVHQRLNGDAGLPSTTWAFKRVKVRSPAGGQQARGAQRRRWWSLPTRNPREPLTIKVSYRGGPECWYEVHARGSVGRFPGYVCIHDVMREINRSG